jgi:hypothetical protein
MLQATTDLTSSCTVSTVSGEKIDRDPWPPKRIKRCSDGGGISEQDEVIWNAELKDAILGK